MPAAGGEPWRDAELVPTTTAATTATAAPPTHHEPECCRRMRIGHGVYACMRVRACVRVCVRAPIDISVADP